MTQRDKKSVWRADTEGKEQVHGASKSKLWALVAGRVPDSHQVFRTKGLGPRTNSGNTGRCQGLRTPHLLGPHKSFNAGAKGHHPQGLQ